MTTIVTAITTRTSTFGVTLLL